ncbi:MAG: hypothetical protein V4527_18910 [Pseudomonadota bacterium]
MNKQISRADIRGAIFDTADLMDRLTAPKAKHGAPFAKRKAGQDRRAERRAVRAAKSAWLNS